MGTSMVNYVVAGIKFSDPKVVMPGDDGYEKFDSIMDNPYSERINRKKLAMVYDGMCGEYVIIGYILGKGSEEDGGLKMTRASLTKKEKIKLLAKIKEAYPEVHAAYEKLKDTLEARFGVWAFSHWH